MRHTNQTITRIGHKNVAVVAKFTILRTNVGHESTSIWRTLKIVASSLQYLLLKKKSKYHKVLCWERNIKSKIMFPRYFSAVATLSKVQPVPSPSGWLMKRAFFLNFFSIEGKIARSWLVEHPFYNNGLGFEVSSDNVNWNSCIQK